MKQCDYTTKHFNRLRKWKKMHYNCSWVGGRFGHQANLQGLQEEFFLQRCRAEGWGEWRGHPAQWWPENERNGVPCRSGDLSQGRDCSSRFLRTSMGASSIAWLISRNSFDRLLRNGLEQTLLGKSRWRKMVWWDNRYLHSMPAKILTIYGTVWWVLLASIRVRVIRL